MKYTHSYTYSFLLYLILPLVSFFSNSNAQEKDFDAAAHLATPEYLEFAQQVQMFMENPGKRARDKDEAQCKLSADFVRDPKGAFLRHQRDVKNTLNKVQGCLANPLYTHFFRFEEGNFSIVHKLFYALFSLTPDMPVFSLLEEVNTHCATSISRIKNAQNDLMILLRNKHLLLHCMASSHPELLEHRLIWLTDDSLFHTLTDVETASQALDIPLAPVRIPSTLLLKAAHAYHVTYQETENRTHAVAALNKILAPFCPHFFLTPLSSLLPSINTLFEAASPSLFSSREKEHYQKGFEKLLQLITHHENRCITLDDEWHTMLLQDSEHIEKLTHLLTPEVIFTHIHHVLIIEYLEHLYMTLYHYYAQQIGITAPAPFYTPTILTYIPDPDTSTLEFDFSSLPTEYDARERASQEIHSATAIESEYISSQRKEKKKLEKKAKKKRTKRKKK